MLFDLPVVRLAIAAALLAAAPSARAQATMLPYETCNKGMAPAPCSCNDMPLVESFYDATTRAEQAWEGVLGSNPADFGAAQKAFAQAGVKSQALITAMGACANVSQIILGQSNWFSPVFNSCFCEKTCDILVASTRLHEATHTDDHIHIAFELQYVALLALTTTSPVDMANRMIAVLGTASEINAHQVQAKYLKDQLDQFVADNPDCTWTPVPPPPGPPPPPPPSGFLSRLRALGHRVAGGANH